MENFGYLPILILVGLVQYLLPIVVVVLIIRAVIHRNSASAATTTGSGLRAPVSQLSPRQLTIGVLAVSAGFAGLLGLYVLPAWLLGITEESVQFGVRLVIGLIILTVGVVLRHLKLTGGLLMSIGLVLLLTALPFVFEKLGSVSILAVIFLVLVALIGLTIYLTHREKRV